MNIHHKRIIIIQPSDSVIGKHVDNTNISNLRTEDKANQEADHCYDNQQNRLPVSFTTLWELIQQGGMYRGCCCNLQKEGVHNQVMQLTLTKIPERKVIERLIKQCFQSRVSHSKYLARPCTFGQSNATISTWVWDIINTSVTSRSTV